MSLSNHKTFSIYATDLNGFLRFWSSIITQDVFVTDNILANDLSSVHNIYFAQMSQAVFANSALIHHDWALHYSDSGWSHTERDFPPHWLKTEDNNAIPKRLPLQETN